jgi:hypothetical protein
MARLEGVCRSFCGSGLELPSSGILCETYNTIQRTLINEVMKK